jgi:hypothetical protein
MTQRLRSPRVAIFLAFLGLYLVTGGRETLWADAKAVYRVAENYVRFGRIDIGYPWPEGALPAPDGKFYSVYPALPTLTQLPAAKVQDLVRQHWPQAFGFLFPLTSHFSFAALAALTNALFFGLCVRLGVAPRVAGVATLALGAATMVFPYAHDPFSDVLQLACFTAFFDQIISVGEGRARGLAAGIWAGLLVNSKLLFALALPGAAAYVGWQLWRDRPRLGRTVLWAAAGFAPFVALFLIYLRWRYGGFSEPAVGQNAPFFRENPIIGLWGLFASPGKSVFRYSPPLVVALVGLPHFWREHRRIAVLIGATAGPMILMYARYALWPGEHAWGPRYLLFAHAVLLLPGAIFLDALVRRGLRPWHQVALAAVFLVGVGTQVLGLCLWRGHWIRISRDASRAWLGEPNHAGSFGFDDFYVRAWLPTFDPIRGHLWLARHVMAGDDAATAEADAPWREYTKLALLPVDVYQHVRFDLWWRLWIDDFPQFRNAGVLILLGELALLAGAGAWWWRVRDEQGGA